MTVYEIGQGLAVPYALTALHGTGGAAAALLATFMAVTSASSAELIACSSILTYDIYRTLHQSLCNWCTARQSLTLLRHRLRYLYGCVCDHVQLHWRYDWMDDDFCRDYLVSTCFCSCGDIVHHSNKQVGYDLWASSWYAFGSGMLVGICCQIQPRCH